MTRCIIRSKVISLNDGRGGFAITICKTHDWDFGQAHINAAMTCPIGQIEQARDEAIAAINAAKEAP